MTAGLRAQAVEYRAEAARLHKALERAGLALDVLSPPTAVSTHTMAAVANLLAIHDPKMSRTKYHNGTVFEKKTTTGH
ncbi:hypothetical protein E2562_008344 [Oryza meyeriana var. granulata]|uniref:Uncharacterized protein n=1 Tax=Oryza meyeriana var. granulata TaxID=110450 RepID=A0A6G1EHU8_9ORYZ|nr:hypothetical protein E2562_008344 [Oryza meyeriana var. granulata]